MMPLEAISCTGCGSADVQEVKPSTYFCNHCETVFKHIDPTRVNVSHTPGFCDCGSGRPVKSQCQLCTNALCRDCDMCGGGSPYGGAHGVYVRTVGWGYLRQSLRLMQNPGERPF
jgi:hypothetical protein